MALDYSAIEDAIVVVLKADAWLDPTASNVNLIEARVRELAYTDDNDTWGLALQNELPGIIVEADPARRAKDTVGEHINYIPITVMAIVADPVRTTARSTLTTLVENLERVIEKQVSSAQAWGLAATTIVSSMTTEMVVENHGKTWVGKAEMTFDIDKITSIEGI